MNACIVNLMYEISIASSAQVAERLTCAGPVGKQLPTYGVEGCPTKAGGTILVDSVRYLRYQRTDNNSLAPSDTQESTTGRYGFFRAPVAEVGTSKKKNLRPR